MTIHAYLRIDGVGGGASGEGYAGWIACASVSWSLRGAATLVGPAEIRFMKAEDAVSPVLAQLCITGATLPGACFDFLRVAADGGRERCYRIELDQVTVANVATGPRHEQVTMETVVLAFAQARLSSTDA